MIALIRIITVGLLSSVYVSSQDWTNHIDCWYDGSSFNSQTNEWNDKTNNANDAVITSPSGIALNSGSDINNELYVSGTTATSLYFSDLNVLSDHTVINLCKYYGLNQRRIIQSSVINALFGFWAGRSGVAYEDTSFITLWNMMHDWVFSIQTKNMYRANGVDYTVTPSSHTSDLGPLGINYGIYGASESSDWACAEVIIMSGYIVTDADIIDIEEYIYNKYKIGFAQEWRHHINAWYDGWTFDPTPNIWYDKMGNTNNAPFTNANGVALSWDQGDINNQPFIAGTTQTSLYFAPNLNVLSTHTVINMCKYNGAAKQRIIESSVINALFGFWNGLSGIAFEEGWITPFDKDIFGDEWLLSIQTKDLYRANGIDMTLQSSPNTADLAQLGINIGSEISDWACAEVLILNGYQVNDDDIKEIETYFDKKYNKAFANRVSSWFDGISFNSQNNEWKDKTMNRNDAIITNPTHININNALYVEGTTSTSLRFGLTDLNVIHSVINLCKYNGINKRRIIQSSQINALFGFWESYTGVAYENGWITDPYNAISVDDWILSIQTKHIYRANGIDLGVESSPNTVNLGDLTINEGNAANEKSDFACAEVIIINNYEVNGKDIMEIEDYFKQKYMNSIVNIDFKSVYSLYPTVTPIDECDIYVPNSFRTKRNHFIANIDVSSEIIIEFYFRIHSSCAYSSVCCNIFHIGNDDGQRLPAIYYCNNEQIIFYSTQNDQWDANVALSIYSIPSFIAPSTKHHIYIQFNSKKKLIKIDAKTAYLDENANNNFDNSNYHAKYPLYLSNPWWPTFDAEIDKLCVKTSTFSLQQITSQIGSINNDLSTDSASLNLQNLYCGHPDYDKPLWAGLLAMDTDVYESLQNAQNDETVVKIHEYIQCTEAVYYVVKKSYSPIELIDPIIIRLNELMDVLDAVDVLNLVDALRTQTISEINAATATFLDSISSQAPYSDIPYSYGSWANYQQQTTPAGDLFNPINAANEMAKVLSYTVCDQIYGSIDVILEDWYQSSAIQDLIQAYDTAIQSFLTDSPLLDDDIKAELLANDKYKEFSLASTAGMNLCFSKGAKACVTRAYGVSFNLKNEYKTFESRSVGVELPSKSIGLMSHAFFHHDFMSNYNDITSSDIAADIGIVASVPGLSAVDDLMDAWDKVSTVLPNIPFVGDSTQIGVDFVNGKLEDFEFLFTILSGGLNAKLSIVEGVNDDETIDCKAYRINLNAARQVNGVGLYFGIDYRKNVGEIELNDDWTKHIREFQVSSIAALMSIFWDIGKDIVVDVTVIGAYVKNDMISLVTDILDSIVTQLEEIPKVFVSKLIYLWNLWSSVLNAIISAKGDILSAKSSCVNQINYVKTTLNDAKHCWDDCDATDWMGFCLDWIEVCIYLSDFVPVSWIFGPLDVVCNVMDPPYWTLQTIENNAYTAKSVPMQNVDDDDDDNINDKDAMKHDALQNKLSNMNFDWYRQAFYAGITQSLIVSLLIGFIFIAIKHTLFVNKYKSVANIDSDNENNSN